jgi:hypothetical protein
MFKNLTDDEYIKTIKKINPHLENIHNDFFIESKKSIEPSYFGTTAAHINLIKYAKVNNFQNLFICKLI